MLIYMHRGFADYLYTERFFMKAKVSAFFETRFGKFCYFGGIGLLVPVVIIILGGAGCSTKLTTSVSTDWFRERDKDHRTGIEESTKVGSAGVESATKVGFRTISDKD
jgi:hypothetical protein